MKGINSPSWKTAFYLYSFVSCIVFLAFVVITGRPLSRLRAQKSYLRMSTYLFCLIASAWRAMQSVVEFLIISGGNDSGTGYSIVGKGVFYALLAGALLCICEQWRLTLSFIDDSPVLSFWKNPVFYAFLFVFVSEALHMLVGCLYQNSVLDNIYSLGVMCGSVVIAGAGLVTARRLYARLSAWISTGHAEIYAKVVFCATAISAITAVFVVVDVLELLFTRFYNWECLLSWVIQRVIEVGYLLIVLQTIDSQRTHATPNRLNTGFDTGSFLSSAMSEMHFASASGSMQTVASSSSPGGLFGGPPIFLRYPTRADDMIEVVHEISGASDSAQFGEA